MSDVKSAEQIQAEADQAKAAKAAAAAEAKAAKTAAAQAAKEAKAAAAAEAKVKKEAAAAEAKAAKDAAAQAKADAKAAELAAKAAAAGEPKVKVVMPSQNGITRPKDGTKTAQVWSIADSLSAAKGGPVAISELSPHTSAAGLNDATNRTQYARWKQFNGVFGVVAKTPAAPAPAPVETAAA
jgi:membrane protein involved in colicin uptake